MRISVIGGTSREFKIHVYTVYHVHYVVFRCPFGIPESNQGELA